MIFATLWAIFLPPVKKTIYFHQKHDRQILMENKYKNAFSLMYRHFMQFATNKYVLKWSFWWALTTCGFVQAQVYMQPLWAEITSGSNVRLYNGAVEAVLTLLGFGGALLAGISKVDWKHKGELILSLCSISQGALLLISASTENITLCYCCYVGFGGLFHFMITVASAEVAKQIAEDSYGLVFGFNTLVALALQTLLTLGLVTGDIGYALKPRGQYLAYGVYHFGIASIFIVIGLISWIKSGKDINKTYS